MCPPASCFRVNCITKNCDGLHLGCKCDVKVCKREIPVFLDQRGTRKLIIPDIDKDVSKMWARAAARDEYIIMEVAVEIEKGQAGFRQEQVQLDFSDDSAEDAGNNKSELNEYYIQTTMSDNSSKRNLSKLPNLASVCDRWC